MWENGWMFKKKKKINGGLGGIIVGDENKTLVAEGYNRLKDNVLYMNADGNKKVIQVESAVKSEGKTTVICNLAVALGLTEKKVVLVDLDFRRPRAHRLFKAEKELGIAEYVLDKVSLDDITKHTAYKNVALITRGEEIHNSSLVLVSDKFKNMIKQLREKYDYVLLDCPPILQVSDYIHISDVSDGVLFVVAYAQTTKTQVADAIKELKKNNTKILGTVFSMYDKKKDRTYDSGAYDAYYYYYKADNED